MSPYLTSTNWLVFYSLSSYSATLKGLFLALKIAAFISEEWPKRFSIFFPTIAFVVGKGYDIFKEAGRENDVLDPVSEILLLEGYNLHLGLKVSQSSF